MTDDILSKALYEAVDEGFTILGRSARMIISGYISRQNLVRSDGLYDRVEEVSEMLEVLLGQAGRPLQKQN